MITLAGDRTAEEHERTQETGWEEAVAVPAKDDNG